MLSSSGRPSCPVILKLSALVLALWAGSAAGQTIETPARQVTVFGVLATPGDRKADPKLARVESQLRKLFPGNSFRLLDVQSKRLAAGESLTCKLDAGFTATTTLVRPADGNGKAQLRYALLRKQAVQLESDVTTPLDQLFFSEKSLDGGKRLLVGIGVR